MKKTPCVAALALLLIAAPVLAASYWVVTKDGSRYEAKSKWTIVNGKAMVTLVNGNVLSLDPNVIDAAKSDEVTRLGGATLFAVEQLPTTTSKTSVLGNSIHLRKYPSSQPAAPAAVGPADAPLPSPPGTGLSADVVRRFERAFENAGIFQQKLQPTGVRSLRAGLTADTEDLVFKSLNATAILIVTNAGLAGVQIESVDLFMKTTNGNPAGRFHITREDAQALASKAITPQAYFVGKVMF